MSSTILIIGGTGAQGGAVVGALANGKHNLRVLTRNAASPAAQEIAQLGNVTLIEGDSSNSADLRRAFQGVDACYVNTNGFALGEKEEIFWGIKTFELAAEAGVKHYVYAGLPYVYKRSGYNPKYNVGHLDAKGRVADFISAQPTEPMNWTVVNSAYYLEMFHSMSRPRLAEDGKTYVFLSANGNGSTPMITLPDLGLYTKWVFENPEEARGLILDTATEHVNSDNVVKAFTELTGKPAIKKSIPPRAFGEAVSRQMSGGLDATFGENGMNVVDNFEAFMEVHSLAVPPSQGLWTVDYERLDKILPERVKSVGEWMRNVNFTGEEEVDVLKTARKAA